VKKWLCRHFGHRTPWPVAEDGDKCLIVLCRRCGEVDTLTPLQALIVYGKHGVDISDMISIRTRPLDRGDA
jgi:hypothetical protein